jgi:hypothetical protein
MPWPLRMTLYMSAVVLVILIYFGIRYCRSVKYTGLQPAGLYCGLFLLLAVVLLTYPGLGLYHHWFQGSFSMSDYPKYIIYIFWYGVVFTGVCLPGWFCSIFPNSS